MRIVSLLPSATELLLAITGRVDHPRVQLVGRSHECDWPEDPTAGLASLPALTGAKTAFENSAQIDAEVRACLEAGESLYQLDTDRLATLKPDVILTQDLCAVCSIDLNTVRQVAAGMSPRPEVLSLNPDTVEGVLDDLLRIGGAIGLEREAMECLVSLRERMYRAADVVPAFGERPIVGFLEWIEPLFVGGHWTPQLIERAGADHPLNPTVAAPDAGAGDGPIGQTLRRAGKSVTVTGEVLAAVRPTFLFVAPCGLNLETCECELQRLVGQEWFESLPAVRMARAGGTAKGHHGGVWCIDGNQMFNRPGPRLFEAFEFLAGTINGRPEILPPGFPAREWTG